MTKIGNIIMFYEEAKATLSLEVAVENDIEVDENGNCQLLTLLFLNDDDHPSEVRIALEDVMDNLVEYYQEVNGENTGYGQMYAIANEFSRYAERLRDIAGQIEEDIASGYRQLDLFDDKDD